MTHTRPNLLHGKGPKAFILDCGSEPIYTLVVTFADGTISIVMILLWDTEISSIFMPVLYAEQAQSHSLQTVAPSRPPKPYCHRSIQTSKSTHLHDRQSHDKIGIGWKQSDSRQSDDGGLSAPSNQTIIGPSLVNGRFL